MYSPPSADTSPAVPAPRNNERIGSTGGAPRANAPGSSSTSHADKLRLQVLRVQLKLRTLSMYAGPVDGNFNALTKTSLRNFQLLHGIQPTGLMTTATLNALGVPAAN
jgi:His-Xaa-Ser repeat protein HxsA